MDQRDAAGQLDAVLWVDTPERVRFSHRLAGPGLRALALVVDFIVLGALATVVVLLGLATIPVLADGSVGVMLLAWFVVSWGYGAALEGLWQGRTLGKLAVGLRVVRLDGGPIGPVEALLRNLLRAVDGLPMGYVIGGLCVVSDPHLRRLGDLAAGTVVVVEQRGALAEPVMLSEEVSEVERHALPARVVLSAAQRRAIEGLLRRRSRLGSQRTEELAQLLAPELAEQWGVEAPTALRTLELAWVASSGRVG